MWTSTKVTMAYDPHLRRWDECSSHYNKCVTSHVVAYEMLCSAARVNAVRGLVRVHVMMIIEVLSCKTRCNWYG
jgi:hypothetical protein